MAIKSSWSKLALPLALVVSGCNLDPVQSSRVDQAPTYSASALAENGIVIGAVDSAPDVRLAPETSTQELAAALRVFLVKHAPDMKILMPDSVEQALGAEEYRSWTDYARATGRPKTACFPQIRSKQPEAVRYLLVALVERDDVSHSDSENTELVGTKTVKNGRRYSTSRSTKMLFRLYDLETTTLEWNGHFETDGETSQVEEKKAEWEKVVDTVDAILGDGSSAVDSHYPPPKPIHFLTNQIFDAFTNALFDSKK